MERVSRKNTKHPTTSNAMFYTGTRMKVVNQNRTKLALAGKNTWQQQKDNKIVKSLLKKRSPETPRESKKVSFAIGTGTRLLSARERGERQDDGLIKPVRSRVKQIEVDQNNISHNEGFLNES